MRFRVLDADIGHPGTPQKPGFKKAGSNGSIAVPFPQKPGCADGMTGGKSALGLLTMPSAQASTRVPSAMSHQVTQFSTSDSATTLRDVPQIAVKSQETRQLLQHCVEQADRLEQMLPSEHGSL